MRWWLGTVIGECASKANSRKIVTNARTRFPMVVKSEKAQAFALAVTRQTPVLPKLLEGSLRFSARVFYASMRPDLDASALIDALQGRIFTNDRQIVEMHLYRSLDRDNPRAVIRVEEICELALSADEAAEAENSGQRLAQAARST